MTRMHVVSLGVAAALAIQPAVAQVLVLDSSTMVGSIETVCAGAGLDAREDPRWNAYGLKIEFAGEGGKYLGRDRYTSQGWQFAVDGDL